MFFINSRDFTDFAQYVPFENHLVIDTSRPMGKLWW